MAAAAYGLGSPSLLRQRRSRYPEPTRAKLEPETAMLACSCGTGQGRAWPPEGGAGRAKVLVAPGHHATASAAGPGGRGWLTANNVKPNADP